MLLAKHFMKMLHSVALTSGILLLSPAVLANRERISIENISIAVAQSSATEIRVFGNKCLDVYQKNSKYDGAPIVINTCNRRSNQQWRIVADGSIQGLGGKCLDINNGQPYNGALIVLWTCNGVNSQRWSFNSDGSIKGLESKCLDVYRSWNREGNLVVLWSCQGGANQQWALPSYVAK